MVYRVEISNTIYVVADSENEARKIAKRAIPEIDYDWDFFMSEETVLDDVEPSWQNAIPWGASTDDKTVKDYILGMPAAGPENMEMDL